MPTAWIYALNKQKLTEELENRSIEVQSSSTVEELRKQLAQIIKSEEETQQNKTMPNENETNTFEKAISRWKIQFDTSGDAVEFLEKIEELSETVGVDQNKIIKLIPICLTGRASLWYRNNKQNWKTWKDFTETFKLYYYPRDYEKNLLETIIKRKQQHREKFIDYLTDLQTVIRRYGKMMPEEQLERIYDNMNPNYQLYVKRKDFDSLGELIQLASDYEKITANRDKYKTQEKPVSERQESQPEQTEETYKNPKTEELKTERKIVNKVYKPENCCWKCGKENHTSRECRNKQIVFCSRCGLLGKLTKNCCGPREENNKTKSEAYTAITNTEKDNRMFIPVRVNGTTFKALIDTGSTDTYINREIMNKIGQHSKRISGKTNIVKLADGSQIKTDTVLNVELEINGRRLTHQVTYLPSTTVMIVGMDLLQIIGVTIEWNEPLSDQGKTEKPESTHRIEANRLAEQQTNQTVQIKKPEKVIQSEMNRLPAQLKINRSVRSKNSENTENPDGMKPKTGHLVNPFQKLHNHKNPPWHQNIDKPRLEKINNRTQKKKPNPYSPQRRNPVRKNLNYNWREPRTIHSIDQSLTPTVNENQKLTDISERGTKPSFKHKPWGYPRRGFPYVTRNFSCDFYR